ncbi:MAG: UDP-glucose/GDP-mannose dehydrogenase family protein [Acidobacteriia bacterium]|nr:UDP-glucose/GDP-mannose dehydrogenase family protein [Terriglobia bacterium]
MIAVLGLGHVGLPTALGFAELGWEVVGADDDAEKVALLNSGKTTFYEAGLQTLLTKHLESGAFRLADDVASAIRSATVVFICVGTPQKEDGAADLSQVEKVARTIAHNLNGYKLIVSKSTVPAITGQWIEKTVARYARVEEQTQRRARQGGPKHPGTQAPESGIEFDVASNPEFLQEGKALENFFHPDRIVIGVESEKARKILKSIYGPLKCPIAVTNTSTAELVKHAANAFLSTKISFINMVADVCEAVGADIEEVAHILGLDPRIGGEFLHAGIGFGGYCFPKDLRAFLHLAEEHGVDCGILKEVERVNLQRTRLFVKKVRDALWVLKGKTIGVWGLAFKPDTDDIREAPSLRIVDALMKEGASLRLYDPKAVPNAQRIFPEEAGRLAYCSSAYEAARGAHALLLLTEWDEFRRVDFTRVRGLMEVPVLVDGRNLFDPHRVRAAGLEYHSVGRGSVEHPTAASTENRGKKEATR